MGLNRPGEQPRFLYFRFTGRIAIFICCAYQAQTAVSTQKQSFRGDL
ncbi:hypothetical protein FHS16_005874 [Paenibacillus endophyticus]|uniref:Uncharacterized protein n=1 Tax=Paenibacillus endophyticus TaxID=1294268 RepID=A0A7W5CDL3_9BACL|nr:hypothetical protein [Paenibacillus endophyticus]MBB3155766.1 hypothetical protein [Paenibacillus endophyticus]